MVNGPWYFDRIFYHNGEHQAISALGEKLHNSIGYCVNFGLGKACQFIPQSALFLTPPYNLETVIQSRKYNMWSSYNLLNM